MRYIMVTHWDGHWDSLDDNKSYYSVKMLQKGMTLDKIIENTPTVFVKLGKDGKSFKKAWTGLVFNIRKFRDNIYFNVKLERETGVPEKYKMLAEGWHVEFGNESLGMRRCLKCSLLKVENPENDLCPECLGERKGEEGPKPVGEHSEKGPSSRGIHTVYVIFQGHDNKIGSTKDLDSRLLEIKRKHNGNKLVYFREFSNIAEAMGFEAWLKELSGSELNKLISEFQDKILKVEKV